MAKRAAAEPLLSLPNDEDDDDDEARRHKLRWTAAEDMAIMAAVQRLGTRWPEIAAHLPGRSDDSVRNRWHRLKRAKANADTNEGRAVTDLMAAAIMTDLLLPQISEKDAAASRSSPSSEHSRASWSAEEDATLFEGVRRHGCKWRVIGRILGRSDSSTRNRYKRLLCEGAAPPRAARDGALSGSSPLPPSPLRPPLSSSF